MATVATELARAGVKNTSQFDGIGMPFPLRDYQVEGLNLSLRFDRFGLYFEPRLGKTFVFLLNSMYCANYAVRSIIIAPPIIHSQLKEEWNKMEGNKWDLHIFAHQIPQRRRMISRWWKGQEDPPDVLVMTKEIFIKEWKALLRCGYRSIIWDECHTGLQKAETKIYAAVSSLLETTGTRILLSTGTPIPTSPVNAYPIISLNNPWAYQNQGEFERQHVVFKKIKVMTRNGREALVDVPDIAVRLDDLHKNLYAYAIRKTRIGTLSMRAPDVAIRDVTLAPAHMKLYRTLVKQRVLEVGERMIKATQESKLRQVAAQLVMSPQNYSDPPVRENAMLRMVDEIVSEYEDAERFVLVAHYNQSVETLGQHLAQHNPCLVYGQNSPADNQRSVERFKSGASKFLIMNPAAGGVGLTLGHVCSIMIFVEPVSTYGVFDQAVSRVLLVDKKDPVTAYILRPLGTAWVRTIQSMLDRSGAIRESNRDAQDLLSELLGS